MNENHILHYQDMLKRIAALDLTDYHKGMVTGMARAEIAEQLDLFGRVDWDDIDENIKFHVADLNCVSIFQLIKTCEKVMLEGAPSATTTS